jgi:hypothetical protein
MVGIWKFIGSIFTTLTLLQIGIWGVSYVLNPSPAAIDQAGQIIAQAAIPWWMSVIQFLAPLGIIGSIGVVVLLVLVARNGG